MLTAGTVITFGCWDLLHVGHVRFLERASRFGSKLVVCVASDKVIEEDKKILPSVGLAERLEMLDSLRFVDLVIPYYSLNFVPLITAVSPRVLAVGEDWGSEKRHKDAENVVIAIGGCTIKLPRTVGVSSSQLRK